jgi:hypothetical protein
VHLAKALSLRFGETCPAPGITAEIGRQAGTYRLAVIPGAGHVSPDEGIAVEQKQIGKQASEHIH